MICHEIFGLGHKWSSQTNYVEHKWSTLTTYARTIYVVTDSTCIHNNLRLYVNNVYSYTIDSKYDHISLHKEIPLNNGHRNGKCCSIQFSIHIRNKKSTVIHTY